MVSFPYKFLNQKTIENIKNEIRNAIKNKKITNETKKDEERMKNG